MQSSESIKAISNDQGVVVASLDSETLSLIAQKLYGNEEEYIRRYIDTHFTAPNYSKTFTQAMETRAKTVLFNIFNEAFRHDVSDVEIYIEDEWNTTVKRDNRFRMMFFKDRNLENDDSNSPQSHHSPQSAHSSKGGSRVRKGRWATSRRAKNSRAKNSRVKRSRKNK